MSSKYHKGRYFEYKVKKLYESDGWFVIRAAGSKGVADLVAIAKDGKEVHFIQCKKHGVLSKQEREQLVAKAYTYNAVPILASQGKNGRSIKLYIVTIDGIEDLYESHDI